MKLFVSTIGCRANQADTDALIRGLDRTAIRVTEKMDEADIVVINTCCVTKEAERDCRKQARRALGISAEKRVVFTGCAVSAAADLGDDLSDRVEKRGGGDCDPRLLAEWLNEQAYQSSSPSEPGTVVTVGRRARAILKVQNGCSHGCSYCIVPRARGPETSLSVPEAVNRLQDLEDEGYTEVVLSGVQLGAWGRDLHGEPSLPDLVQTMADSFSGRLRLSSIEPWSVTEQLIDLMARHPRVCPHLHVPLQSGDRRVLDRMARGYDPVEYIRRISQAKRMIPDLSFGTDVILGFPGEDEQAFDNTVSTLRECEPAYVHAFPFSARPGTPAAEMSDAVPRQVARERVRVVRALGDEAAERFRSGQVGSCRGVVVEERRGGELRGLTDNYLSVQLVGFDSSPRELVQARLEYEPVTRTMRAHPPVPN